MGPMTNLQRSSVRSEAGRQSPASAGLIRTLRPSLRAGDVTPASHRVVRTSAAPPREQELSGVLRSVSTRGGDAGNDEGAERRAAGAGAAPTPRRGLRPIVHRRHGGLPGSLTLGARVGAVLALLALAAACSERAPAPTVTGPVSGAPLFVPPADVSEASAPAGVYSVEPHEPLQPFPGEEGSEPAPELATELATADAPLGDLDSQTPPVVPLAEAVEPAPEPAATETAEEPKNVTFDELAGFVWVDPNAPKTDPAADAAPTTERHGGPKGEKTSEVPASVLALAGKPITVEGYMIPLEFGDDGNVKRFLLSRYMMGCCFGAIPAANEMVLVEMPTDQGAIYEPYYTVLATGKFKVSSEGAKVGGMTCLYSLAGTKVRIVMDR